MQYYLYTTVDITNTGQYRSDLGAESLRWKEQNFQSVLQTLGIRSNIESYRKPEVKEVAGSVIGFNTPDIIRVWYFEFDTERNDVYETDASPVGCLLDDFNGIPYISGLDESMNQNYDVFVTEGCARNIVFFKK